MHVYLYIIFQDTYMDGYPNIVELTLSNRHLKSLCRTIMDLTHGIEHWTNQNSSTNAKKKCLCWTLLMQAIRPATWTKIILLDIRWF